MNTEEAKEKLFALKVQLDKIEKRKNRGVNVFDAAGLATQEVKHSAFLAWLLDPAKPHGLGTAFLRKFCKRLMAYSPNGDIIGDSFSALEEMLCDENLAVLTEKVVVKAESRTDIFIVSQAAKTVMVIENKVFTTMHDNQLNRYEDEVNAHDEYKHYNKVYVYLTPHGDSPQDEDWCVFDYGGIVDIVREISDELTRRKADVRLKILLEDYIETVDTNILSGNKELRALCKQILREHGEATEILKNYTDNAEDVIKYCNKYLKDNYNGITIYNENKLSFAYYTQAVKEFFERNGESIEGGNAGCKCERWCGQWDGPICGIYALNKSRDEQWSVAQKKIMAAVAPDKKHGNRYFRFYPLELLSEADREKPFADVKSKLDSKLAELVIQLKKFDALLATL